MKKPTEIRDNVAAGIRRNDVRAAAKRLLDELPSLAGEAPIDNVTAALLEDLVALVRGRQREELEARAAVDAGPAVDRLVDAALAFELCAHEEKVVRPPALIDTPRYRDARKALWAAIEIVRPGTVAAAAQLEELRKARGAA